MERDITFRRINYYTYYLSRKVRERGFLRELVSFGCIGLIKDLRFFKGNFKIKANNLVFASTNNQEKVLKDFLQILDSVIYYGIDGYGDNRLPKSFFFIAGLVNLRKLNGFGLKSLLILDNSLWCETIAQYGSFYFYRFWLKRITVKNVIVSNEHIGWHRALIMAANSLGINTIYYPHAHINKFLPRNPCKLIFLYGTSQIESLKYNAHFSKIIIAGMSPSFAPVKIANGIRQVKKVGVVSNTTWSIETCEKLIFGLSSLGYIVYHRSHPADTRFKRDSSRQALIDYLDSIDFLIAPESSVILEGACRGKRSFILYCNDSNIIQDYYGFKSGGLVERSFNDVTELLKNLPLSVLPIDEEILRKYNHDYGRSFHRVIGNILG